MALVGQTIALQLLYDLKKYLDIVELLTFYFTVTIKFALSEFDHIIFSFFFVLK